MKTASVLMCLGLTFVSPAAWAQTGGAGAASGAGALTLKMPASPDPAPVTLDATKTAILVADMVGPICGKQAKCTGQMVPKIASLLSRAREAKVYVLYTVARPGFKVLPSLAPASGDPVFVAHGQDRFYKTDLDSLLKAKGITTLILVGWKVDGSVLYTSVAATLRGYTVVVPEDASLAPADYEVAIGRYMILTQARANASNSPLKPGASTLSRTDMITFK